MTGLRAGVEYELGGARRRVAVETMTKGLRLTRALASWAFLCYAAAFAADVPLARLDLREFGYQVKLADCSQVLFLSDDLVLASINQIAEPAMGDRPASTLVVFDISRKSVATVGKMPIEKTFASVQAISKQRFALLNAEGLQYCDSGLHCERIGPANGPLFASPEGKRIAFGGYFRSPTKVVDTETLEQVALFDFPAAAAMGVRSIPGDDAILVDRSNRVSVQSSTGDIVLSADKGVPFPEFRFLNQRMLAYLDPHASEAVIAWVDDFEPIRRYKVSDAWGMGFLTSATGKRFAIYEHGYTAWNQIRNFPDIAVGRPENYQRVRVFDLPSGGEVAHLEWDPRPSQVAPALSPGGHYLARVKAGVLEVLRGD